MLLLLTSQWRALQPVFSQHSSAKVGLSKGGTLLGFNWTITSKEDEHATIVPADCCVVINLSCFCFLDEVVGVPPAGWTGPDAVLYWSFDTLDGLVVREGGSLANEATSIYGKVKTYILCICCTSIKNWYFTMFLGDLNMQFISAHLRCGYCFDTFE